MIDYALIQIALRAEISLPDGSNTISVSNVIGFTSSFAINTIPTGVLTIAVGTLATAFSKVPQFATINNLNIHLTSRAKVKVFMFSKALSSRGVQKSSAGAGNNKGTGAAQEITALGVPADGSELLIFEGNISGTGRTISSNGAAVATIYLEHWLTNLNYASALSATSDPGNPSDMRFSAVFHAESHIKPESGLPSSGPVAWLPSIAKEVVSESSMQDLWGEVLYKWLLMAVSNDPFIPELAGAGIDAVGDTGPILDAINRLKPNGDEGVPLALAMDDAEDSAAISHGIRTSLITQTGTNWINTTLWGKLVGEWSPEYFFAIIPRVSDGLIVPLVGPLAGEPWAVIGNEDYVFAKTDTHIPQRLRGVGIIHPAGVSSGFNQGAVATVNVSYGGFGGFYEATDVAAGMVLIKSPPAWLSNQYRAGLYSGEAEGVTGGVDNVLDADGEISPGGDVDGVKESAAITAVRGFMQRYAKEWYLRERLKGRTGEVAGKLRFDICPGSNIRVEADNSGENAQGMTFMREFSAIVMQVNYVFDVEAQRAGTSFIVTHVHTVNEHKSGSNFVVDRPAIYRDKWFGASMVSGIKPETPTS